MDELHFQPELESQSLRVKEIVDRLPGDPGVYLMKDRKGQVIYVGKAQNLKQRVRSYFTRSGDDRRFIALLERTLGDIETIVTNNEKEALLLENNLIKQYKPRFNVKLIDDKNYLVLRLNLKADYPRLEVARNIQKDGSRYFGPYHSASSCRQTLQVINRHFKLRTCTDQVMKQRTRPCLQYQIKRCDAPCVFPIPKEQYGEQVKDVMLFLEGKDEELVKRLSSRMSEAAEQMDYEVAAALRDQMKALKKTLEEQRVVSTDFIDQDVFGFYRKADELTIAVLRIKQGKLMGQRVHYFRDQEFPDEEAISAFVGLYYDFGNPIPDEILLPVEIEDKHSKEDWLQDKSLSDGKRKKKGTILSPKRGARHKLVELANKNAAAASASRRNQTQDTEEVLVKLQKRLNLHQIPRRIECFDISHLQGAYTVASRVVFIDGEPARSEYRTYKIRSSRNDDFASMYEVISRRFRRAKQEELGTDKESSDESSLEKVPHGRQMPDLLVIDGGKGQLASALAAIKDVGADPSSMDVVGLAKEREDESGQKQPDRVFLARTKDPIKLRLNTAELFILSRIRDEAHRFAVTFHKKQRSKQTIRSTLGDVPGIGPRRQKELLKTFGSLLRIQTATLEELAQVPGMNLAAARAVIDYLGTPTVTSSSEVMDEPAASSVQSPSQGSEDKLENAAEEELEYLEETEALAQQEEKPLLE